MSATPLTTLIARCRLLCRPLAHITDGELLRRFAQQRDAVAFEELLERHAVLVWGVCRRLLPAEADCEDAFQATFLALVRQAEAIEARPSLAAWLHTVAVRVARKALARSRRQQTQASVPEPVTRSDAADEMSSRELLRIVDEEIARLPSAVRAPLILCCLQGQTRDEAAAALGCSVAAVKGRLERGRDLLRRKLMRRGVALPAAFLALSLTGERVDAGLWARTVQAVLGTPSPAVAALARAGLPIVMTGKGKLALAALLLAASTAGVLGSVLVSKPAHRPDAPPQEKSAAPAKKAAASQVRTDRHGDPLPEGAIARLGTVRWRPGLYVSRLAYSPDGKKIAAAGGKVTLWDVASGKRVQQLPLGSHMAFSPDGTMLATADRGACHLWDVATGKELRQLKAGREWLQDVAFAPDGKTVAGGDDNGTLYLWETATGVLRRSIECKQGVLWKVGFSPDGRRLATGDAAGSLCLWDPHTGKELHRLKAHPRGVFGLLFSPDGKRLLSSGFGIGGTIREWDAATGRPLRTFGEDRRARGLPIALTGDGALLASGEGDGRIRLWDMVTGEEKRSWSTGSMPLWTVTFSPDGKTLASGALGESSIRLWDVATARERHPSREHIGPIEILHYSSDGKTLVSVSPDRRMLWWDLTEQRPRRQRTWSAQGEDSVVALSPDGNTLAVGSQADRSFQLQLWDVRTGKPSLQLANREKRGWPITFSPDGRLLASCVEDSRVTLWDVRDGKEVRQIGGIPLPVRSLCFSPDGKTLAVGLWNLNQAPNARTLQLWDVASGKEKRSFDVPDTLIELAFSPDGKVLAGGNGYRQDTFVRLWDIRTGTELCRHTGHRQGCGVIAFSGDGKLVASATGGVACEDTSVHVWEAATGRLIRRFEGHRSDVVSVAFAPDGLTVACGGGDSTILLWDVTGRRRDGLWTAKRLTAQELDACWTALASENATRAYDAVWSLVASPEQGLSLLRHRLQPIPHPDAKTVAGLIADLDSDEFAVRQKAARELARLGEAAAPAVQQALEGKPSAEVRRRLQQLLDQGRRWSGERLRDHRAIQALEHIGTRGAQDVLESLAGGASGAYRTGASREALRRLRH